MSFAHGGLGQAAEAGFVGMEIQNADPSLRQGLGIVSGRGGVMVRDLLAGGPAAKAGLRRGDLVLRFQGADIENLNQLVAFMQTTHPAQTVEIDVWRDGHLMAYPMTIGEWPPGWRQESASTAVIPNLGLTVVALTPDVRRRSAIRWGRTGVLARTVEPTSVLYASGLRDGDLIVAVGRTPIVDPAAFERLFSVTGTPWALLVERTNQIYLLGNEAAVKQDGGRFGSAFPVVIGDHVLAAQLPDGPYVMDVDGATTEGSAEGSVEGSVPSRGGTLPTMPTPRVDAADSAGTVNDGAFDLANVTDDLRRTMGLRWAARGVVVTKVTDGGRAARAGLVPGHVITAINGGAPPTVEEALLALGVDGGTVVDGMSSQGGTKGLTANPPVATLLVEARDGFFLTSLSLVKGSDGGGGERSLLNFARPN